MCSKGLCPDCAADLGLGLACKGVHENDLSAIDNLISRNIRVATVNRWGKYTMPVFFVLMGGVLFAQGVRAAETPPFAEILGGVFVVLGLWVAFLNLRVGKTGERRQGQP